MPYRLSYKTKLVALFLATALLSTGLNVAIMQQQRWELLLDQRRSKLKTLAGTTAALLSGDLHAPLLVRTDETTPQYRQLDSQLRQVRDANRRSDFYVSNLYTVRAMPEKPETLEFVVDPEESRENKSHIGDIYKYHGGHRIDVRYLQCDRDFHTDQWGRWLTANAPIRDSRGQIVGAVCADLSEDWVMRQLTSAMLGGMLGLAISLPALIGCALLLARWVRRPLAMLQTTVGAIGAGDLQARAAWPAQDEFGMLAAAINAMAVGLQERERVKSAFARYVSRTVLDRVVNTDEPAILRGERRRITVLFSDIRDFTTFAEQQRPEAVVLQLNEYFEAMIEVVIKNKGWVDKFLGDGLMVTFGAFETDPDHEEHAICAALEMQAAVQSLRGQWEAEGRPLLEIRIGINTGSAMVGEIGSSHRAEFTALGDTVNLASRLETACKEAGASILISEYTYQAVRGLFDTTDKGALQVKGRQESVMAYAVNGIIQGKTQNSKMAA